jgi:SAM-dependent methyltransferase
VAPGFIPAKPGDSRASTEALFERLAPRYDESWTDTPVGRAQRNAVWRVVDRLFHAGDRVLDIGCGTGEDTIHLASLGAQVHAIDASPAMVAQARARGVAAQVLRAENLGQLTGPFDGALSIFGVLNCVPDLAPVARALAELVRPGGHVAICTIGRFCAWELLYHRKALRRLKGRSGDVYYPTVRQLRATFARDFDLLHWHGIGMLVPPSYVKLPARAIQLLARLEHPILRAAADHRLLVFKRK